MCCPAPLPVLCPAYADVHMNSAIRSNLIIDVFIAMAVVISPLSLSDDRGCHVVDTVLLYDIGGGIATVNFSCV